MGADLGKFEALDLQSHKPRAYSKQQKEEFELLKNLTIFFNRPKSIYGVRALPADVYLPTTERQLHGDSELTITGFLIGFATIQLV